MSKIKTGEVVHHTTGDIWEPYGAILGSDFVPIGSGTVRVTQAQATAAEAYGWEVVSEDDGIVLISRSLEKAELFSRKKRTQKGPCQTATTPASKLLSCIILAYKRADRAEITSQEFEDYALGLIAAYVPGSEAVSVVPREPRQLLAQAYLDNGDYGSAATIRSGHDLTPNTQIALLAIKNALALAATPTPPTLSEDLRADALKIVEAWYANGDTDIPNVELKRLRDAIAAALAQVKAS